MYLLMYKTASIPYLDSSVQKVERGCIGYQKILKVFRNVFDKRQKRRY